MKRVFGFLSIIVMGLLLTSCGNAKEEEFEVPKISVSSYPLAYIVEQVGGDHVEIEDLSKNSGTAHNLELSPSQVAKLGDGDLTVYISQGFQPAVEKAVSQSSAESFDVLEVIPKDELIHGDSHIWLDPILVKKVAKEIEERLIEMNPESADYYQDNYGVFERDLGFINSEYEDIIKTCENDVLFTTHEAFGYLAKRYGLDQVGVTGVDPEVEPSPARILELKKMIEEFGVTTLFIENSTSKHQADELSKTLGVNLLPLDTMEVEVEENKGMLETYADNLYYISQGLDCSVPSVPEEQQS